MADITTLQAGNVSDEGKTNWRGDQVSVVQGAQSIYQTSSINLAGDLGSRKVVGDRVFRYAQAGGTIAAGQGVKQNFSATLFSQINITASVAPTTGDRIIVLSASTNMAADAFAEGTLFVQSGTAANQGYMYRIKTHGSIGSGVGGAVTLYDAIQKPIAITDSISIMQNMYKNLLLSDATGAPAGGAPISVVSSDYFWLQTWGPLPMYCSAVATAGNSVAFGATGQVQNAFIGTDASSKAVIGYTMQPVCTASQLGVVFLQIAP